jgi:tRNA dimethylallyltransferase
MTVRSAVPVRVIIGPTGGGKSALAMALAERHNLAIISADSRQIYTGFDIGTAKPTVQDRARVPHFGVDIIDPVQRYSAFQWATDVPHWERAARDAGRGSVIVGGSGFYVRALVSPFDASSPPNEQARVELNRWLALLSSAELRRWCRRLDPDRAELGRTQQLRAVETALLLGTRISESFLTEQARAAHADSGPRAIAARYLVVDPGLSLATRIAERTRAMLAAGWVSEIEKLLERVPENAPAWGASGYRVLRDAMVAGRSLEVATERVVIETRQYAKRQRTWCRHQLPAAQVTQIDSRASDALERASTWWESDDERLT